MHRLLRPSASLIVFLLLSSLSLIGCSGAGTPSSATTMTLKVAQVNSSLTAFPLYIAQQQNYFKAQGLTLDPSVIPSLGSGPKLSTAVESGSVEVGIGAITDMFTLSRVDAYVKMIGALTNGFTIDIVVSKHFEQQTHVTATSPLADKVRALVGKKIGISAPGGSTDALLTYLFRQQGLDDQKTLTKVNLGSTPSTGLAALQSGRVDAISFAVPTGAMAEAQGFGDIFISPDRGDIPELQGFSYGIFYTRQQTIDAKPQAIQAFIRAIANAEDYIHKNPAKATTMLGTFLKLNKQTNNVIAPTALSIMPQNPQISQQGYEAANQFHVKAGLIAVPLAYKDLVATDTIAKALNSTSTSS